MAHARTQIRNAVKDLLLALPVFSGRVFATRFTNLQVAETPSAIVYSLNESSQVADVHDEILDRSLELNVSIKAQAISNLDTLLDDLAEDVEVAIDSNPTLSGKVQSINLTGCNINIDEDGEIPAGEALLQYQVNYYTQVGAPDQFS